MQYKLTFITLWIATGSIAAALTGSNVCTATSTLFMVTDAVTVAAPKLSIPAVPVRGYFIGWNEILLVKTCDSLADVHALSGEFG